MTEPADQNATLTTETYRRDDGWEVVVTHDGTVVTALSHLPMIVQAPPEPLTIEYVRRACRAHGYVLVAPAAADSAEGNGTGLPTFTEAHARSLSDLTDVPVFQPAPGWRVVGLIDLNADIDTDADATTAGEVKP